MSANGGYDSRSSSDARASRLHNLNLNLLVSLDVLLRERNVSAAARSVGVAQPTMSSSLSRLRRHFDDELLVRKGRELVPTALGVQLSEPVKHAIVAVSQVFGHRPDSVDAVDITREFRVISSDYGASMAVAPVAARIAEVAPRASVTSQAVSSGDVATVTERLRTVDGMVVPHGIISDLPHIDLFEDTWVAVVPATSELPDALSIEDLLTTRWVLTYSDPAVFVPVIQQMRLLGIRPHAVATVESFAETAAFVSHGPFIGAVQARLARRLAPAWGLRIVTLPFDPVPITQAFWWHPVHDRDGEHRWFRRIFSEIEY